MKRTWTIEFTENKDGTFKVNRTNENLNPMEILGLIEHAKHSILKQLEKE